MLVAGLHSCGHDTAFCILEDGIPIIHIELERIIRQKQPTGDAFQLLMDHYPEFKKIKYFTEITNSKGNHLENKYPYAYQMIKDIAKKNGGEFYYVDHHKSHASNAFYSSNFDDALIVTMDGGGWDVFEGKSIPITISAYTGCDKSIVHVVSVSESIANIGAFWNHITQYIFDMSVGWPKGSQVGSVMAMASYGNPDNYIESMRALNFTHYSFWGEEQKSIWNGMIHAARGADGGDGEKEKFDIAAALQKHTEEYIFDIIRSLLKSTGKRNLCLSGGVALNCVMVGKMHTVFEKELDDIYICPVPYDAGLAIGAPQFVYHQILGNDRIKWEKNCTPYLGKEFSEKEILDTIEKYSNIISSEIRDLDDVLHLMGDGKIISLFHGKSESGRRALGNRSIIADPRNPNMKDIINQKVKHRQWYRPFAPSILKEHVKDWFVKDVSSPYMGKAIKFIDGKEKEVPAVNHVDNTARLQTVTKEDNELYYNLIHRWNEISGVPIVLNTSFNDREPIVETPGDGIKCFLNTNIDHMYFLEYDLLLTKK